MKAQKAVELARRMTVLCHFPSGENGIEQVARLLLDICDSDKAGEQLVSDVIRHCDEWMRAIDDFVQAAAEHAKRSRSPGK